MARLTAFVHVSADGCFAGPNGEIDWFKAGAPDPEYDAYTHGAAESRSTLVFGRTTYEMMKSWWPTPEAIRSDPQMARVVDESPKIVFSRTLARAEEGPNWKNVELLRDIDPAALRRRKEKARADFTILGSGSIVRQLGNEGLLDELDLVVVPLVLGSGKPLFRDFRRTNLELLESRSFPNGRVILKSRPVGAATRKGP